MKQKSSFLIGYLTILITLVCSSAMAADYYVVIGTFAAEENARRYLAQVSPQFSEAAYCFNGERKVYYVHVLKTGTKEEADKTRQHLRLQKGFRDAWIYADWHARLQKPSQRVVVKPAPNREPRLEPTQSFLSQTGPAIASSAPVANYLQYTESPRRIEEEAGGANAEVKIGSASASAGAAAWQSKWGISYIANITPTKSAIAMFGSQTNSNNLFTFLVEDEKGREIQAEVMLVDFEKARRIAGFDTGEFAAIRGTRREQMFTLVCDVLGYAQETRMYNIDHLSRGRDIQKNEQGIWEVRFKLKKMELHDIAFLNRTTFHSDAAVLESASQKELDELTAFMKKNPSAKIIIHAHCNPGSKRTLKVPATETNYFNVDGAATVQGTDKKLTKMRASVVRNYLLAQGIEGKRIGMVGWGGLEPLVSTTGPETKLNDRVEFELVAE